MTRCSEAVVAGLGARLYVMAAMDPAVDADALHAAVKAFARAGLTDAAVTLMRGWVEHRESGRPVLAWHRLLGDVTVSVGRAA